MELKMIMKKHELVLAVLAAAVLLAGCESPYDGSPDRTGTGALAGGAIGAASGALIGSASGHAGQGALIGSAVGLITGGLIGHSMDQEQQARLRSQSPQTYQRVEQGQPLGLADVKAMAKAGISDEVIISQIRTTHTVYHLSAADIIELNGAGVSQKVIDFMINTATSANTGARPTAEVVVQQAPPPPQPETIIVAPAPNYVWCRGEWVWNDGWVWVGGHWVNPPYQNAVWIEGSWVSGPRGWRHAPGHWRY